MSTSFSVVCYKSKTLKNGENPLMLQVSKNGKRQYKSLGVSIHPKFWDSKKNRIKQNCPNKEIIQKIINDKLAEIQNRVLELNAEKKEYTTTTLLNNDSNKFELKTVVTFYKELIAEFTADNFYFVADLEEVVEINAAFGGDFVVGENTRVLRAEVYFYLCRINSGNNSGYPFTCI